MDWSRQTSMILSQKINFIEKLEEKRCDNSFHCWKAAFFGLINYSGII